MSKLGEFRGKGHLAIAFAALALIVLAAGAQAQTVGKIEGTVTDRDTGQPLPGAQVIVAGTQLGNISDDNGYYFVNNVPPGSQTVSASFLGYQAESGQYRILAGQTTTVNFALSTEVIVADSAIVTVTEREPLVPRDNTISKSRFIKENVQDLPLTSVDQLVSLAAGASNQQGGISLRGARPDDATVYVDGLNATDYSNTSGTGVGRGAVGGEKSPIEFSQFSIEQLDVVTGGADASFGDAQSGVVNIVTSRGGRAISGNLRFTTDAMNIERTDDFYQMQGSIGGPLLSNGKASFFLSGDLLGTRTSSDRFGFDPSFDDVVQVGERLGVDVSRDQFCLEGECIPTRDDLPVLHIENFVNDFLNANAPGFLDDNDFYGNNGDTDVYPGAVFDRYSFSGKLAFTPGSTTDIQVSYSRSRDEGQDAPGSGQGLLFVATAGSNQGGGPFNPFNNTFTVETADFAVASWRQIFYQESDKSLAIEARLGYFNNTVKGGPLFDPVDAANGFPLVGDNSGGDDFLNFRFSDYELFFEDSVQTLIDDFDGENTWQDIEDQIRQPLRVDTPDTPTPAGGGPDIFGVGAFGNNAFPLPTVGFPRGRMRDSDTVQNNGEERWNPRVDLDMQVSRIDRLQGGVDLKFFDVNKLNISLSDRLFNTAYFVEPRLFGFYATNRIDLGDFVLDLGGRVDYFDHNTELPEVPGIARTDLDGDGSTLRDYDTKTAFAPRLGVAHPVTEDTQVRFSYGVFNQLPGMDELYQHLTSDITANDLNSNAIIGNPDLDFQQTKSFELGITHLLSEDFVLDLVAYNRDIEQGTAARFVVTPQAGQIEQLFNVNNGNVRGFDLTLTKRFSNYWSADATYSFMDSKMTDSDQDQFTFNRGFNSTADNPIDPPASPLAADFDVTHKLALTGSLRFPKDFAPGSTAGAIFRDFGLFATARFNSGLPFTRQPVASGLFLAPPNTSRAESTFRTDVRATKYFVLASDVELGAIFEIFNLFNNDNIVSGNQAIPFGGAAINNGVFGTSGDRFITGNEIQSAEQTLTDDIVIADICPDGVCATPGDQLTQLFRSWSDIDGDGVVTREEQRIMGRLAFGSAAQIDADPKRQYRLGVELRF
jgi:outer membrane receptor protein involved in Fe transport